MKHYRATPLGMDGEPIVARGLRALYDAANAAWGLTATYPSVRNNMLPEGRRYRARDGWVEIKTDPDADAAYDAEQINAVLHSDSNEDYQGRVYINYKDAGWNPGDDGTEFTSGTIRTRGLLPLFREAQTFVRSKLGALPPGMEDDELLKRLPNIRSQMSKSRSSNHAIYPVPFPTLKEDYWMAPTNWPARVFVAIDAEYEAPRQIKGFVRRD